MSTTAKPSPFSHTANDGLLLGPTPVENNRKKLPELPSEDYKETTSSTPRKVISDFPFSPQFSVSIWRFLLVAYPFGAGEGGVHWYIDRPICLILPAQFLLQRLI